MHACTLNSFRLVCVPRRMHECVHSRKSHSGCVRFKTHACMHARTQVSSQCSKHSQPSSQHSMTHAWMHECTQPSSQRSKAHACMLGCTQISSQHSTTHACMHECTQHSSQSSITHASMHECTQISLLASRVFPSVVRSITAAVSFPLASEPRHRPECMHTHRSHSCFPKAHA